MANDIQKKIIIVGGGIVGNLLHLMLESKGFSIHHFEKKPQLIIESSLCHHPQ